MKASISSVIDPPCLFPIASVNHAAVVVVGPQLYQSRGRWYGLPGRWSWLRAARLVPAWFARVRSAGPPGGRSAATGSGESLRRNDGDPTCRDALLRAA